MAARELQAAEVGLPRFSFTTASPAEVFDLESHRRAREALDFGLSVSGIGFNIFVIGDDRAARMTATMAYLTEASKGRPVPPDWVYLNNFQHPASPTPLALPPGMGRRLRDRMAQLVPHLREALAATFTSEGFQARILAMREQAQSAMAEEMERLRATARSHGTEVLETQEGGLRLARADTPPGAPPAAHDPTQLDEAAERDLGAAFARLQRRGVETRGALARGLDEMHQAATQAVAAPLIEAVRAELPNVPGLAQWLAELAADIMDNPGALPPHLGRRPVGRAGARAARAALCGEPPGRSRRRDRRRDRARKQSHL